MVFFGYMILTGALFPIDVIPIPFRYISMAIPFTYFIDLMRNAALSTSTILPAQTEYLMATILAFSMLLIGFAAFNKIEGQARVKGTISAM
jgi:ABC-type polysaccharide/polyol phosphate export permease